tara:strand:+ start:985 stop:1176 length:192 start_codon:yes stop_codon:yes gene_type:complete
MSSKETEEQWEKEKKEAMMRKFVDSFWSVEYTDEYGHDINIADGLCRIAEHLSVIASKIKTKE